MIWIPVVVVVVMFAAIWATRVWSVHREKDPAKREETRQALYFGRDKDGEKLSSDGTSNTSGYGGL